MLGDADQVEKSRDQAGYFPEFDTDSFGFGVGNPIEQAARRRKINPDQVGARHHTHVMAEGICLQGSGSLFSVAHHVSNKRQLTVRQPAGHQQVRRSQTWQGNGWCGN
jgi:hypothetical protein